MSRAEISDEELKVEVQLRTNVNKKIYGLINNFLWLRDHKDAYTLDGWVRHLEKTMAMSQDIIDQARKAGLL